jgi:hypothetical protein
MQFLIYIWGFDYDSCIYERAVEGISKNVSEVHIYMEYMNQGSIR